MLFLSDLWRTKSTAIRHSFFIPGIYCLCIAAFAFATRNDPFFWDTVQLGSKHAHFFYENGLQWLPLPVEIDSGHPPVFGYYLAILWTIFGKSLAVSHFALLPFSCASIVLLWRIGRRLDGKFGEIMLPLLVFADPVVLGQSALVAPDVVVITALLATIEGVWTNRKWLIIIGILGLCAISMRGMMAAGGLGVWGALRGNFPRIEWKTLPARLWPYLPGYLFGVGFLLWHWKATGWIGYHAGSPWAQAFAPAGWKGMARNVAILGWRWLDFGRVGAWGVVMYLLWRNRRNFKLFRDPKLTDLVLLFGILVLFLSPSAILYRNLSAHRYFLPLFLVFHLLVFQLVVKLSPRAAVKRRLAYFLVIIFATGNLWIYPRGISMDWDSTLAHWPYHALRREAIGFLESQNIDFQLVGSSFPNVNTGESLLLNGDLRTFQPKDFEKNQYMMASNIFNDFSPDDYSELQRNWKLIWQKSKAGVWIEIYAK